MKKYILFLAAFFIGFQTNAQFQRDSIIGKYYVQVKQDNSSSIWWDTLVVSKDINNINQIFIWFTMMGGGDYFVYDSTNGNFTDPVFSTLDFGSFYTNDSIYHQRWLFNSSPPYVQIYKGFKILSTGINDIKGDAQNYCIYPNPLSSLLYIQIKNIIGNVLIKIIDVSGREVYSLNEQIKNKGQTISINTSLFNIGVYFLLIENENKLFSKKIVIQ